MEIRKFNRINNIVAVVVLAVASVTYLSTIEPTASFWDCGEFIASSYKLEVGHPPGNPVFQVIARAFTFFGDKMHAAILINSMSALCSALTIFFLYLTIVHLVRRISEKKRELVYANGSNAAGAAEGEFSLGDAIAMYAAGAVGALAYCWSDTFWFSAVEGEVYAMSSLFTAVVVWAMLKWEEEADEKYANRWIVLIAVLMGLSIGVQLLNLLTIPALVLIYYYKKYTVTKKGAFKALLLSFVILAAVLWLIIPYTPKVAAYTDLLFVNGFGLPVNSGAAFFMVLVLALCFWGVYRTYNKNKVAWNTIWLCLGTMMIGYSVFAVVIIRSSVNTPTNEYQPDNPFTLVRYLSREQYGSAPLIYGETYASTLKEIKVPHYYNIMHGKYVKLDAPAEPVYSSDTKMFFPRMYSSADPSYADFYNMYTNGNGRYVEGSDAKIPTMGANLKYFFDYQMNFMYWRYFLWNFVGRQNDLQASIPGDIYKGNWESGITFLDKARLGDQSEGPAYIVHSRAKNHFYFLPLILGLIGLWYQYKKDKRNFFVTLLLFFMTGIAIILYLNQPPYQPRERDYAYAGSFYAFAIWIGIAAMWLAEVMKKLVKKPVTASAVAGVLCLLVPIQMVSQTWNDHDRSGRHTSRDLAYNYLQNCDKDAILVTHGDNDTFPLWYIQEVEGVRTDVRIVNTSLLGTDWYIDQMQLQQYDSKPMKFTIKKEQYYYGCNDYVQVVDRIKGPIPASDAMDIFEDPSITIPLTDGKDHNFIPCKHLLIPVNKENVKKYHIVAEKDYDKILDTIELVIPEKTTSITKTDLMLLDYLAHYKWDRPIYFLSRGGDVNIGEKDYLQYDGFAYKFVPIKSKTGAEAGNIDQVNAEDLYNKAMNVYRLNSLKAPVNIDYQNLLTFNSLISIREIMTNTAKSLLAIGEKEKAVKVLDKMQEVMPEKNFPLNNSIISSINDAAVMDAITVYLECGQKAKGIALGEKMVKETEEHILLFSKPYHGKLISEDNLKRNLYYLLMIADAYRQGGAAAEAKALSDKANKYISFFNGEPVTPDKQVSYGTTTQPAANANQSAPNVTPDTAG